MSLPIERSSASDHLRGLPFDGSAIKVVYKGPKQTRLAVLEDGRMVSLHRSEVHELAKFQGLLTYRGRYLRAKRSEKIAMLKKSRERQEAILRRHMERLAEGESVSEPSVSRAIRATIRRLQRQSFGSPLIGETPATSVAPPHFGPQHTFKVTERTGIKFITKRRNGRSYVVPMSVPVSD